MSDFVLDASLALQWFSKTKRIGSTAWQFLQASLKSALVPILWFYEIGNGLLMACRRKLLM